MFVEYTCQSVWKDANRKWEIEKRCCIDEVDNGEFVKLPSHQMAEVSCLLFDNKLKVI